MFFIFIMVIHNNPFETFLTQTPVDGRGLNPLLQNFYMAIHPPSLYTGFVAMTIPYAFGIAALVTGHLDDAWLRAVRRWTMIGWLFLSFGLTLGMLWAYEELGWGGFWNWDPVENAGLLPWFTATAFLHSVMVQERRGMLRVWNVTLVIVTFFLTIFGTFMTRSGVVQSVHAFGEDRELAMLFTAFMVVILVVQLRPRDLSIAAAARAQRAGFLGLARSGVSRQQLDPPVLGVLRPVRDDVPDAERSRDEGAADGRPAVLQQVDAADRAAAVAAHGHRAAARVAQIIDQQRRPSVRVAVGCDDRHRRGRVRRRRARWPSVLCFALCSFVAVTIAQEFVRGAQVRKGATGTDIFTALVGLVARSRRRYGGYIVHLGIVLMFLGFAGQGFKQERGSAAPARASR